MRRTRILSLAAVVCLTAASPAPANDILDFLRNVREGQRAAEQRTRLEQIQRQQQQNYRSITSPPPPNVYTLPQNATTFPSGLAPGYYETPVPGGDPFRFRVPERPAGGIAGRVGRAAGDVTAMTPYVDAVLHAADEVNDARLVRSARQAHRHFDDIVDAVRRNNDALFSRSTMSFASSWLDVKTQLARYNVGPRLRQQIALADRRLSRLSRYIAADAPAVVDCDRPRLIGLSRQLVAETDRLEDALEQGSGAVVRSLERQARRARRAAEDFRDAVQYGESQEDLIEEFERWDREWLELREDAASSGIRSATLSQRAARIHSVDRAIHETLVVASPTYENERLVRPLLVRVAQNAGELDRELERVSYIQRRGRQFFNLRSSVGQLQEALRYAVNQLDGGRQLYTLRDEADRIERPWRDVESAMARYRNDATMNYANALTRDMEVDLQRLAQIAEGNFGWRYAITP